MKKLSPALIALAAVCAAMPSEAFSKERADSASVRVHAIIGDSSSPVHQRNITAMNMGFNPAFEDPAAPRFLFLDKEGKVALGIGGNVKAVAMYDMAGAIDDDEFVTNLIPVPFNPARSNRFGATASHSSIFLKLVTSPTRLGPIIVYAQTQFSGDNGGYGLVLKQAYVQVGHLTLGKARSTFADGPAMAPTIDDQGPSGQVSAKNMLVQYATPLFHGFSGAISVEEPKASYTEGTNTAAIAQRIPDIPAYVQYGWDKGSSHVRISGLLRQLSYRDTASGRNRFVTGWGVQFSTIANIAPGLSIFGHYTYGKGIGYYVNDLSEEGFDLVPDGSGRLKAPGAAGYTAGLQYKFSPNLMGSASYSHAQLYDCGTLGGSTYRSGQYITGNLFYNVWGDLSLGVEYIHGNRRNYDGTCGKANRLLAMLQYSF